MKIVSIVDPIEKLDPTHDTSIALMESAQARGHELWITQADQLSVVDGKAWALLERVSLNPVERVDERWIAADPWYEIKPDRLYPLEQMDALFMRTDPPVTIPYLYATYILDYIDPTKTLTMNSPRGLRAANEKMYALQFTNVIPETIVSQTKSVIRDFVERKGAGVLKPLGGKAGEGILFLQPNDSNLNSLIEISTKNGKEPVMVQTYLPEARQGDKRIILLNGEPIGAVNRVPSGTEFRGNMAVGGKAVKTAITDRERQICTEVAPKLREDGLYFVGLDVIGGYLTEVNVTSPTGLREIDKYQPDGYRLGDKVIEWVENYVSKLK
ncbi:glutathione synthase [Phormidium sp. CCY1219]|uniref:glutathione synthase n=1 Tax=Phormidium sp. CCY1219 TaxID=2886104 RepID=UPI002D1F4E9B|nr:glutathione synthase [Phormidium sp. CCY1219]MEB3829731.1 glutathione synthase [Phormidium sp. CCY1219]